MEIKMTSCVALLFISLVAVNAREHAKLISIKQDLPMDSNRAICLNVSRKAKNALSNLELFEEINKLSSGVCSILPNDLENQCLEKSRAYLHQMRSSFQELVHENNLCNQIGLDLDEPTYPINSGIFKVETTHLKFQGGRACKKCHGIAKQVLRTLEQAKIKKKVTGALLDSCEEIDGVNGKQCKQGIYEITGVAFSRLVELEPADVCNMLQMCDVETSI